jgi:hypothetical protein
MTRNILFIGLLVVLLVGCATLENLSGVNDQNVGVVPHGQKRIKVTIPI